MNHHHHHHVTDPMQNYEECSEMSSTMFSATSRSAFFEDEKSDISIQQFFLAEERRENVAAETRRSNVRAMKEKFEQASPMSKDGTPKQRRLSCGNGMSRDGAPTQRRLSCGSGIAERKRQLQQSLYLEKDEAPEVPVLQQAPFKKQQQEDQYYNGKGLTKSRRGKAFSSLRNQKHMSRIADKKKMFEKKLNTNSDDLSRDGFTAFTEPTVGTTAGPEDETDHDATLTMTISDSDLSALDYDGSLFSDGETPAPAVRDEIEATSRRSQAPERREVSESIAHRRKSPGQVPCTTGTSLSPNNSFQEALHEIVQSFQDEASINKARRKVAPHNIAAAAGGTKKAGPATTADPKHGPVYVMETGRRDDPSPVSMLTSFDTDTDPHRVSSSRGSSNASGEMITKSNHQDPGRIKEGTSSPVMKAMRDLPTISDVLPNSSLFSTVEQEEERERAIAAEQTNEGDEDQGAPFDEQEYHEASESESQMMDEAPQDQAIEPQAVPKARLVFRNVVKKEPEGDMGPTAKSPPPAAESPPPTSKTPPPTSPAPRYELAEDTQPEASQPILIKGILKQSRQPLSPVSCPSSAASWYSSATSVASEISNQMAPHLQHTVPMMSNSRFSIGGYVNAHLADYPAKPSKGETNASSSSRKPQQPQRGNNHQSSARSQQRQERRDSASSSVPGSPRNIEAASPTSSMDPQFSESNNQDTQDLQEIADAMSSMANTASTAVLDVFVDAADTVVLTPLLSLFSCVDQSESILCSGVNTAEDCLGPDKNLNMKRRRQKVKKSRSRGNRKFKA